MRALPRDEGEAAVSAPAHVYVLDALPNEWRCVVHEAYSDECPTGPIPDEWMPQCAGA